MRKHYYGHNDHLTGLNNPEIEPWQEQEIYRFLKTSIPTLRPTLSHSSVGTGYRIPPRRDVKLTTHFHLTPRLRMSEVIPRLPLYAFTAWPLPSVEIHIYIYIYSPHPRGLHGVGKNRFTFTFTFRRCTWYDNLPAETRHMYEGTWRYSFSHSVGYLLEEEKSRS
jgi:hypothetical protein